MADIQNFLTNEDVQFTMLLAICLIVAVWVPIALFIEKSYAPPKVSRKRDVKKLP